jgi:hypothetical protein
MRAAMVQDPAPQQSPQFLLQPTNPCSAARTTQ